MAAGSGWRRRWQQFYEGLLERRLPGQKTVRLDSRKLFIFPTVAGFAFGLVLLLLWLLAINYQNNLIFAFTFLLSSVFVVTILHTFANLSGVEVSVLDAQPAFAGDRAQVTVRLAQQGRRFRDSIRLYYPGARPVMVAMADTLTADVRLYVPARRRGWLDPGRLVIDSTYPLGLLRVWTHVKPTLQGLVYPKPLAASPPQQSRPALGEGVLEVAGGSDDFSGLGSYRPGESLRHIAWKQYARGQGMLTKHYTDAVDNRVWLDWDAFPGMDREARLSRLCGWLLVLSRNDTSYGLKLPGIQVQPSRGEGHRDRILRHLALFELTPAP